MARVLEVWGLAVAMLRSCRRWDRCRYRDIESRAGELRVLSRQVRIAGHRYVAAVIAPLGPLRAQHAEMVRAMALGVVIALLVAAVGGWLIGDRP